MGGLRLAGPGLWPFILSSAELGRLAWRQGHQPARGWAPAPVRAPGGGRGPHARPAHLSLCTLAYALPPPCTSACSPPPGTSARLSAPPLSQGIIHVCTGGATDGHLQRQHRPLPPLPERTTQDSPRGRVCTRGATMDQRRTSCWTHTTPLVLNCYKARSQGNPAPGTQLCQAQHHRVPMPHCLLPWTSPSLFA